MIDIGYGKNCIVFGVMRCFQSGTRNEKVLLRASPATPAKKLLYQTNFWEVGFGRSNTLITPLYTSHRSSWDTGYSGSILIFMFAYVSTLTMAIMDFDGHATNYKLITVQLQCCSYSLHFYSWLTCFSTLLIIHHHTDR